MVAPSNNHKMARTGYWDIDSQRKVELLGKEKERGTRRQEGLYRTGAVNTKKSMNRKGSEPI